jgi:hypothetical protein
MVERYTQGIVPRDFEPYFPVNKILGIEPTEP